MLWGSKRTGPDIARLGGKYSDDWHEAHLIYPRAVVPTSIMPAYPWLATTPLNTDDLGAHLAAQAQLGVPYTKDMITNASLDATAQARPDSDAATGLLDRYGEATTLRRFTDARDVTEMDAVIAYLQILSQLTQAPMRRRWRNDP